MRVVLAVNNRAVEEWLAKQPGIEVAGVAREAAEASRLVLSVHPDVVVVARAGPLGGLEDAAALVAWLKVNGPVRVVGVVGPEDPAGKVFAAQLKAAGGMPLTGASITAADLLAALVNTGQARGQGAVVILRGARRGVGTTTVAVNLAVAMGKTGKTVLVDCSESGDAAALLGVAHQRDQRLLDAGGLVSEVAGEAHGIWCLPARVPRHGAMVLKRAAAEFDFVVADSPVDGDGACLLVADQNPLRRKVEGPVTGVVVNRFVKDGDAADVVANALGGPLLAVVHEQRAACYRAAASGKPLAAERPEHWGPIAAKVREVLAGRRE